MKKLITTLTVFAICFIYVKANFAHLSVASIDNAPMTIIIDGQIVAQNSGETTIEGISAGQHFIQINQTAYSYNSVNDYIAFQGEIFLPAQTAVHTLLNNGQLQIQHIEPIQVAPQPVGYYPGSPISSYKPQPVYDSYIPEQVAPVCAVANPIVHAPVPSYPVYHAPQAMDPNSFHQLKLALDSKWFSSGKMQVLGQALQSNFFTAQQVAELVSMFSFSDDRVEVSKMAFTKTVNPQDYYLVYDQLQFNSSLDELSAYIASL